MLDINTDYKAILKSMKEVFNLLDLRDEQIKRFVTDAGGNIIKAIKEYGGDHLHCCAHNLNLGCQDSIEILAPLRSQCRQICSFFHQSNVALATLKKIQKDDNNFFEFGKICYKLINEVKTRWNSSFYMFKRIVLLADNINEALLELKEDNDTKFKHLILSEKDVKTLLIVCKILDPVEKLTRVLSSEKTPTLGVIIPKLKHLIITITAINVPDNNQDPENTCLLFKRKLLESFSARFIKSFEDHDMQTATFLDPKYKSLKMFTIDEIKVIHSRIKRQIEKLKPHVDPKVSLSKIQKDETDQSVDPFLEIFDTSSDDIQGEFESYQQYVCTLEDSIDVLEFWKNKSIRWPILSQLAVSILCIPATSTPSERGFSTMGRIVSKIRNRIHPETAGTLIFLKENTELW